LKDLLIIARIFTALPTQLESYLWVVPLARRMLENLGRFSDQVDTISTRFKNQLTLAGKS